MLSLPVNYSASTLGKMPLIRGGGLTDDYIFQQLHFHWGTVLHPGSEHVIGFRKYPLTELHFFFRSKHALSSGTLQSCMWFITMQSMAISTTPQIMRTEWPFSVSS